MFSRRFSYPLHVAAEINDEEFVEALLLAGAVPNVTDSEDLRTLALARLLDHDGSHAGILRIPHSSCIQGPLCCGQVLVEVADRSGSSQLRFS